MKWTGSKEMRKKPTQVLKEVYWQRNHTASLQNTRNTKQPLVQLTLTVNGPRSRTASRTASFPNTQLGGGHDRSWTRSSLPEDRALEGHAENGQESGLIKELLLLQREGWIDGGVGPQSAYPAWSHHY